MQSTLSHYRVLEQIGAGGMGVVYRAHDEGTLDRDVALKVLPSDALADEAARKRFRKEATALSKLNHPNIATVFEFGSENGTDFLVEELIPGLSLNEMVISGPLSEREVINLGSQLCEGLAAAHHQGVIHRDLKPANIRVTPDARLKILDFGLARVLHASAAGDTDATASLTETQAVSGTFPYMAPEQLLNEKLDTRADIWAAGCVLYEMATGRRPFLGYGPALIDAILHLPPAAPSKLSHHVSLGLEAIILKCLEKDPTLRYASARDIAVDLHRLGTGTVTKALAARRRSAAFKSAAVGLAIVVILAVGWALYRWARPPASTPAGRSTPAAARRVNPQAHELYLKGNHFIAYGSKTKAAELFSQAVSIDPQYAEAWAGLANAYLMQPSSEGVSPMTVFPKIVAAVGRALAIDGNVSEAHAALGKIKLQYEYDWRGAEEEFRRALELNPKDRHAHIWLGLYVLIGNGRFEEGVAELKRGDPYSPNVYGTILAGGLYHAGRYDDAVRQQREALDLDPNFELAHENLGVIYSAQGKHQEAIAELERADALYALRSTDVFGQRARAMASLGYVYAAAGKRRQALAVLDRLHKMSRERYVESTFFAHVHAGLGNKTEAIRWLEKGYAERSVGMLMINASPSLDSLQSDPRFQDLLRRMNFSQAPRSAKAR